jgi:hypothetical protein
MERALHQCDLAPLTSRFGPDRDFRSAIAMPDTENPWFVSEISGTRKLAGWLIRAFGFLLGAAVAVLLAYLMWTSPVNLQHLRPSGLLRYLLMPILVFAGAVWLFDRIASCIDKRRMIDLS